MPYSNTKLGTFGHTVADARLANPNTSIPDGVSFGDFKWYATAPAPSGHPLQSAVEQAPENGMQRWSLTSIEASQLVNWLKGQLTLEYEHRMQVIASGYPPSERESWSVQTAEARALLTDVSASTPWIDAACAARSVDRIELATRILSKDTAYRSVHGLLTGIRQRIEDLITASSSDVEALLKINVTDGWPSI